MNCQKEWPFFYIFLLYLPQNQGLHVQLKIDNWKKTVKAKTKKMGYIQLLAYVSRYIFVLTSLFFMFLFLESFGIRKNTF